MTEDRHDYEFDQEPTLNLSKRNERLKKKQKKSSGLWSEIMSWLTSFLVAFGLMGLLYFFVGSPFTVDGNSMYPTLHDGDKMFLSKIYDIERFDIVVLQSPTEDKLYIKRVIGLPGDKITVFNGNLYINDTLVEQPFINQDPVENITVPIGDFTLYDLTMENKVPEGKYFVMGDNRAVSADSRVLGFIDESAIKGEAVMTLWPLNRIGFEKNYHSLYTESE